MMGNRIVKLYYQECGTGLPVIFLHGFLLDHTIWHPLIPYIEQHARLIMPDLRGHGRSPAIHGIYAMEEMAHDVINLMDDLQVEKAILAGHSMGGYISLAFAHAFPQRLAGIALIASHAAADTLERRHGRYQTANIVRKEGLLSLAKDMAAQLSSSPENQAQLFAKISQTARQGAIGSLIGMAERFEALPWLSEIIVPSLLVRGSVDELVPIERFQEILNILPHTHVVEIPGVGHMPMMEAPQPLAEALQDLIIRVGDQPE